MNHILIVEDEPRLRDDVAAFMELSGFKVDSVATARGLRQTLAAGVAPDVILLDVGLPDGDGFELAAAIRQSHDCGIIMLSALGGSTDRIRGYQSGADIYLVKHSSLREIEAAVHSLLRRTADQADADSAVDTQWALDQTNWVLAAPNHRSLQLTATEFAFMRMLCEQPGETCTREVLVATIARPKTTFDDPHLDAVVSRLRRKLEENTNLPAPIKVVYGVGYAFTAPVTVQ